VLVVINQDYVKPEDFVGALRDAGLDKLAYRGPTSGRWPTLRQMIASDQRVLFLAENEAGGAPWYHPRTTRSPRRRPTRSPGRSS
jgi:hypothetical protein